MRTALSSGRTHLNVDDKYGIRIYHLYEGFEQPLAWWDDLAFRRNNYKVVVWFVHPRMEYKDRVEDIAHKDVPHPSESFSSLFPDKGKNYRKVGKSRKKLVSYTMGDTGVSRRNWYDEFKKRTEELLVSSDVVIRPSIEVKTYDYCLGVSLCVPIEAVNEKGLVVLKDLTLKLLRGETTLEKEFPGYTYGASNWVEETPVRNGEPTAVEVKQLA